jgi:microcystin-dependent protein
MSAVVSLAPFLRQQLLDTNGNPLAGGKIYTYQAGTTTLQPTYTDSTGTVPNSNPVILDAGGSASVWTDTALAYKFIVKDSNDNYLFTSDGVIGLLNNNAVTTAAIQDNAVTTPKILDSNVTLAKLTAAVAASLVPTGSILAFGGTVAPTGYLMCNGAAISRTSNFPLFTAIGTTYGAGDGSTTFNLPNTQGLFLRGDGSQVVGGLTYSSVQGTAYNDTTKRNGLTLNDPTHSHTVPFYNGGLSTQNFAGGTDGPTQKGSVTSAVASTGITINTGDAETRPANLSVKYIIKT